MFNKTAKLLVFFSFAPALNKRQKVRVLLNAHGDVEKLRDVARIVAASGWVKQKLVTDI